MDTQLNVAMRTNSRCIKPAPPYWVPTLSHISQPALRRQDALTKEYRKIISNNIHDNIPDLAINRLRSRKPVILLAQQLTAYNFNINCEWQTLWIENAPPVVRNVIEMFFRVWFNIVAKFENFVTIRPKVFIIFLSSRQ